MSDDRDLRAAEYVLGTLSGPQRSAFVDEMERDPELYAAVVDWERRFRPLAEAAPAVVPSSALWTSIERSLDSALTNSVTDLALVASLRRSRKLWRGVAVAAAVLAAGLALFIGVGEQITGRQESYIAVVNRGGDLPALIVQVDTRAGVVRVRSVSVETSPDRSLELWYIEAGHSPRSLGVLDAPRQQHSLPIAARGVDLAGATLAVTSEPHGGSPTGGPTGPIIYSGKLIRD